LGPRIYGISCVGEMPARRRFWWDKIHTGISGNIYEQAFVKTIFRTFSRDFQTSIGYPMNACLLQTRCSE
ncbi:MAG: hypothetical protein JXM79_17315, partial [Sedimentisphaerales bacterium]|nr:hypothetical protein [Sedimentisphaerales bacterium]